jgi:Flp pilus assembly protein TadB
MTSEDMEKHRQQHGSQVLIPAGILIGLGAGLLLGYAGPGVLIGLGCGLIAASLIPPPGKGQEEGNSISDRAGTNWVALLVGIFMILVGVGIVWTPPDYWPSIVAIFLILLGIWFVARMYTRKE